MYLDTIMINVYIYTVAGGRYMWFLLSFLGYATWHVGFYLPGQGWDPRPPYWMHRVITTVPPSLNIYFSVLFFFGLFLKWSFPFYYLVFFFLNKVMLFFTSDTCVKCFEFCFILKYIFLSEK